jgi:hypothetical protein
MPFSSLSRVPFFRSAPEAPRKNVRPICALFAACSALLLCAAVPAPLQAALNLGFEIGSAFTGRADLRAPGTSGTPFSFDDDFHSGASPFFRLQLNWEITRNHTFFGSFAPLRLAAAGPAPKVLEFGDQTFPAGEPLRLDYKLDTWRLGYLFTLIDVPAFIGKIGFFSRFRSGSVKIKGIVEEEKYPDSNIMFPGHCLSLNYFTGGGLTLFFEGDALGIKRGYACEFFAGSAYDLLGSRYSFRAGWRVMLEKTDSDLIYAKTRVNQFVIGTSVRM